jgi:hypothetical protein
MADTLAEFFLNRNCQRIGFACAGVTINTGGSRPARRHTFFASAKKKYAKNGFLLRRALLARMFVFLMSSDLLIRLLHICTVCGAVTFGPGAALQRGGFRRMFHGLVFYSDHITFKPAQETTALKIVVIT